jgi:uncharacterized membrane protein YfcA
VPMLVLLAGPSPAIRLGATLAAGLNVVLLVRERRGVDLGAAGLLIVPALAVTPAAAYVVHRTSAPVLSVVIGSLILVCAAVLARGRRIAMIGGRRGAVAAGAFSAAMNTASGVGGPAAAMYAFNAGWPAEVTRPTLQAYFLALNLLSLLALGTVRIPLVSAAGLALALVGGLAAGGVAVTRLSPAAVGRAVLAIAVLGGSAAIVRGAVHLL